MTDKNISTLPNLRPISEEDTDNDFFSLPDLTPISEEDTDNDSLPLPDLTPISEEDDDDDSLPLPDLTPISEEDDDCSSMPDMFSCKFNCCNFTPITEKECYSSFGCEFKNIQQEQIIDYNDEEIEKREERYDQWSENRIRTLKPPVISPLFKENYKEE
jgi:hypothetical protein